MTLHVNPSEGANSQGKEFCHYDMLHGMDSQVFSPSTDAALSQGKDALLLLGRCNKCVSAGRAGCRGSSSRAEQQREWSCSAARAD